MARFYYLNMSNTVCTHTHTHTHTTVLWMAVLDFVRDHPDELAPAHLDGCGWIYWVVVGGFTGARDSEWQWHQLGHIHICTLTQSHNHASIPPLSFLQAGCPFCHPANSVRALPSIPYVMIQQKLGLFLLWRRMEEDSSEWTNSKMWQHVQ